MSDDIPNDVPERENRLRWALLLRSWGHIPIPLAARTKKPIVDNWPAFPMPSELMLKQWILGEGKNYGILCGKRSANLCVVDFDDLAAWENWKRSRAWQGAWRSTLTVKSRRGVHLYLTLNADALPERKLFLSDGEQQLGEVLTTGQFVVGPGSIHPEGAVYSVLEPAYAVHRVESIGELELPLKRTATRTQASIETYSTAPNMARIAGVIAWMAGAQEGARNESLFWSACRLFDDGMGRAEVESSLLPVALGLGLEENESLATIRSAERSERRAVGLPAAHGSGSSSRRRALTPKERGALMRSRRGKR